MHRFFCVSQNIKKGQAFLDDPVQLHHLRNVLRFKVGFQAVILDEKGNVYQAYLKSLTSQQAVFCLKELSLPKVSSSVYRAIACALPKKSKFDEIIDKLIQLGIERIIPMQTERVVVHLEEKDKQKKYKRWQQIALNAVRQCQRNTIPIIDKVMDFKEVLKLPGFDLKLIPHLQEGCLPLQEVFNRTTFKSCLCLIGPEGDFTPEEISLAKEAKFTPVSFGDNILRVETACLYIASILNYELQKKNS
ncbi:MAG: 16S rRNA (uracil(1498)-N(3))-methyltransferase [Candidatus Omnitrophica bacterium]|nr:16S rRNA (uracil(1498)-N(3))-methyltransferase [Candidatus Omnitrophota bacterium]